MDTIKSDPVPKITTGILNSQWREINGQTIEYGKKPGNSCHGNNSRTDGPPLPPESNQPVGDQHSKFDYAGGPF